VADWFLLPVFHQPGEHELGKPPPNNFSTRIGYADRCEQGAKYGYIWAGSNLACLIFFFFFIPELKGRTLEEIDELFTRKVSAWKFKSTKTTIGDEALRDVQKQEVFHDNVKSPVTELVEDAEEKSSSN
jgi:hypothetical protein